MEFLNNRSIGKTRATAKVGTCLVVAILLAALTGGCTQTFRAEQADLGDGVDIDTFLHEHLQNQAMVTVAEAYRAMILLADGDDEYENFEQRRASLEQRKIARPQWNLQREVCIDRGSIAYMICRILKIRGGINYNLLGGLGIGERRYAMRELLDLSMMDAGSVHQYMTGGELVDLIGKADRYMADRGMYEEEKVDIAETLKSDVMTTTKPE
ncbi:MAG: hypothetical protein JSV03_13515 [Planctomycetota bacterium]|nr:MAG: hypothetical protein JSV03_13515 [Planctomycetota bacterium]